MYETGQQKGKAMRGDLRLAIFGDLQYAARYCERYNKEFAFLELKAEIWSYFGSKPCAKVEYVEE